MAQTSGYNWILLGGHEVMFYFNAVPWLFLRPIGNSTYEESWEKLERIWKFETENSVACEFSDETEGFGAPKSHSYFYFGFNVWFIQVILSKT